MHWIDDPRLYLSTQCAIRKKLTLARFFTYIAVNETDQSAVSVIFKGLYKEVKNCLNGKLSGRAKLLLIKLDVLAAEFLIAVSRAHGLLEDEAYHIMRISDLGACHLLPCV